MSFLTEDHRELLQSWYDYSRLPLWLFTDNGTFLDCFVHKLQPDMKSLLINTVTGVQRQAKKADYNTVIRDNELYIIFPCQPVEYDGSYLAIIGPLLLTPCVTEFERRQLSFASGMSSSDLSSLVSRLHVLEYSRADVALQFVTRLLQAVSIPSKRSALSDILERIEERRLSDGREEQVVHTPYRDELAILNCVREGDLTRLDSMYRDLPEIQYGNMSSSPLHQMHYAIVSNITLVARYAIEGGMPEESAFRLSDQYIQQIDRCRTVPDLLRLNEEMAVDFTSRVAESKLRASPGWSHPTRKCVEIISQNPRDPHTLSDLAEEVGLTPKYLSSRFRKDTGKTLHEFIEEQKVLEAEHLLLYGDLSLNDISHLLHFGSQSYFTAVFKKRTGMTPRAYRLKHQK